MTLWGVRSGKYGERESLALEKECAVIGWDDMPNLSAFSDREALRHELLATYPDEKAKTLSNWESQLWPFAHVMAEGDTVVMPLKQRSGFALGRIKGPYAFAENGSEYLHTRPVEWIKEIPRSALAQDLQHSFGAFLTVFQVFRNNAEMRVKAVISGKQDPAFNATGSTSMRAESREAPVVGVASIDESVTINIEQVAEDAIRFRIATVFKGHKLAALIGALLETENYKVVVSPPGADGGVDILAGKGPLGFDAPRLDVQVKSQDSAVDVGVLRELQGVMRQYNADRGLLVAWGGVTKALTRESQRLFFETRIWDSGDVIRTLQQNYDKMSEEIQADLPLKRIWTLSGEM